MVSIKCVGLFVWHITNIIQLCTVMVTMNLFAHISAQIMEAGDGDISQALITTTESPIIQEWENPYPKNHPCYRFANTVDKVFYSPAYPPDAPTYPSLINCSVVLTAPSGYQIELDFRDVFQIESTADCSNDYLEVRDGAYGFNKPLGKWCHLNKFPPKVVSSDRHLWVYFRSDESLEYKGFKAVFDYVPRSNASSTPEIIPCVTHIKGQEQGRFKKNDIKTEILDFDRQYGVPIDCMWVITVQHHWRIHLQFEDFQLDKPNDCENNFVEVFSNETTEYHLKQKFCGSMADTLLSDPNHNVMIVRFYAESLGNNKTTFAANFTAFREYSKDAKEKCVAGEFDCDDATCISDTLKCNGLYNCRYRWDEDKCDNTESWALTDDHIVIIMVIFSLILTGMCATFLYNCIKKLIRDHNTMKEFKRSMEQLDKQDDMEAKPVTTLDGRPRTPSAESNNAIISTSTPCYVPGGDVLPILIRNGRSEHSVSPTRDMYHPTNIYAVDNDDMPKMCDSACQTRESLFTTQEYSSGTSTPNHSVHTNSPPAPFSTFGYNRKDNKFKAEAKIEMHSQNSSSPPSKKFDKRRPYSVQTTKSAPDVIVTH